MPIPSKTELYKPVLSEFLRSVPNRSEIISQARIDESNYRSQVQPVPAGAGTGYEVLVSVVMFLAGIFISDFLINYKNKNDDAGGWYWR
jgi:hypothetical protein